jgi:hypothetical protein
MKTDELIAMLARGAGPAPRAPAARRLLPAVVAGTALAAVASIAALGIVPASMLGGAALWAKLAYAALAAAAAGWGVARLARPGASDAAAWRALAGVVAAMALAGALDAMAAPRGERVAGLLGHSWSTCPWSVLALSVPALALALWALRGLAPTRPLRAGFAAGVLAGAVGALGYALTCPEQSLGFVAIWYTLGIGLAGALGALVGPRALRW